MGHAQCILVAGTVCLSLGLIMVTASLITDKWLTSDLDGQRLSLGLWSACIDDECVRLFSGHSDIVSAVGVWLRVCQACATLGLIMFTISFILLMGFIFSGKQSFVAWISFHQLIGGLVYGVTVLVFFIECYGKQITYEGVDRQLHLATTFYVALIGTLIALPTAGLFLGTYKERKAPLPGYIRLN